MDEPVQNGTGGEVNLGVARTCREQERGVAAEGAQTGAVMQAVKSTRTEAAHQKRLAWACSACGSAAQ